MAKNKLKDKTLNWYVVFWSNDDFVGTDYRPSKAGILFGVTKRATQRFGFNEKTKGFEIVEKSKFLFRGTIKEFDKWLKNKEVSP